MCQRDREDKWRGFIASGIIWTSANNELYWIVRVFGGTLCEKIESREKRFFATAVYKINAGRIVKWGKHTFSTPKGIINSNINNGC